MSDTFSSNDGFNCYQHTAEEAADAQVNNTLRYPPAARSLLLPPSNVPGQEAGNSISKSDLIVTSSHFTYNDGFSGGMSSIAATESPSSQLLPTLEFEAEQWHLNPPGGKAEQGVHPLSGTIGPNSSALQDLQSGPDRVVPAQENVTRLPGAPSPRPISQNWLQPGYSDLTSTPFDISQALYKLATRPAPLVNIDATNATQSFVVTDTWQSDMPVIYVSDGFEILTGYPREEVLGKNCRFLQARNGVVKQGASRECVSSASAHELKEKIAMGQEVQHVIVNFRKSGEPLNNLLTLVPIPWDGIMSRFWFGFQNDISQQPTSLNLSLNSVHEGSLLHRRKVQSSLHKSPPSVADRQVIKNEPETEIADMPESAARMSPDSTRDRSEDTDIDPLETSALVTDLLTTLVDPENQNCLSNKTAWSDVLLQNIDGLLQVLSLKGTIVYISPSCHRLGYISTLLLGSSIENICHPSDKLIVRRELKNATTDKEIDIIFRIKQHDGDYAWYHNYGSVWVDGGRRWAVLVGRQLTMFALSRQVLDNIGGLGERDIWMKLSTSGLVLSVFPNPLPALGMPAEKLVGTSFHELIINGCVELCKDLISRARTGNAVSANVAMQSARGHSLHVELTIHPGQSKQPQFHNQYFLFAQCRFVKVPSHKSNAVPAQVLSKQTIQQHIFPNPSVYGDNLLSNLEANNCGVLQYDLHQLMTENENLRDELQNLEKLSKQRKRLRVSGGTFRGCANCHTRQTPEWRRGPSGRRDLCNSCGLRWAKSVRTSSQS